MQPGLYGLNDDPHRRKDLYNEVKYFVSSFEHESCC